MNCEKHKEQDGLCYPCELENECKELHRRIQFMQAAITAAYQRLKVNEYQPLPNLLDIRFALQSLRTYADLPLTEKDKAWIDSAWEQYKATAPLPTITE